MNIIQPKRTDIIQPSAHSGPGPVLMYLARLRSDASRRSQRWKLDRVAQLITRDDRATATAIDWCGLQPADVAAIASLLTSDRAKPDGGPYAARTVNAFLAAVRGVLRECWRAGMLDQDTFARLADVRSEPVSNEAEAGRSLAAGEVAALFDAVDADRLPNRSARDRALMVLLYGAGLRAGEACKVDIDGIDLAAETVTVLGKGRKTRTVDLAAGAADTIRAWLEQRGDAAGPLLLTVLRGDRMTDRPLTPRAVQRIADRLAEAASVKPWTPHDLRRTYIGDLLDRGADLATVQRLAGHADPATTARYDRRPAEARRRAARLLSVPVSRSS